MVNEFYAEILCICFFTDPRTIGFSNGKLLDDKYVGFYSLKWFDDFPYEQNNCISEIVYKLATSTTLFGKKVEPSEISRLTGNEDMVFAACLIVKHMHIIETNCIEVSTMSVQFFRYFKNIKCYIL